MDQLEFDFIDAILGTPLTEAVVTGYDALFEAKHGMIGKILTRLAHRVSEEYALPMDEAKSKVVQLQRLTMDQFAPLKGVNEEGVPYKPETQPEFKYMMTKYFTTVLTMLCNSMGYILASNNHITNNLTKFYVAFNYMVRHHDKEFDGNLIRTSTGEQYTPQRIIDEFYDLAIDEKESAQTDTVQDDSGNTTTITDPEGNIHKGIRSGHYTIIHIPNGDTAKQFSDAVRWCICANPQTYWSQYSENNTNKCYFIIRDEYEKIADMDPATTERLEKEDTEALPYYGRADDLYGRSMIGMFVEPSGEIASLYNRHNSQSNVYDDDDLSKIVEGDIHTLCPGYKEGESQEYDTVSVTTISREINAWRKRYPQYSVKEAILNVLEKHEMTTKDNTEGFEIGNGKYLLVRTGPQPDPTEKYDEESDDYYEDDRWGEEYEYEGYNARFNIFNLSSGRPILGDWATAVVFKDNSQYEIEIDGTKNIFDANSGRWVFNDWVNYHYTFDDNPNFAIGAHGNKHRLYDTKTFSPASNWINGRVEPLTWDISYYTVGHHNLYDIGNRKMVFSENVWYVTSASPLSNHFLVIKDKQSPIELYNNNGERVSIVGNFRISYEGDTVNISNLGDLVNTCRNLKLEDFENGVSKLSLFDPDHSTFYAAAEQLVRPSELKSANYIPLTQWSQGFKMITDTLAKTVRDGIFDITDGKQLCNGRVGTSTNLFNGTRIYLMVAETSKTLFNLDTHKVTTEPKQFLDQGDSLAPIPDKLATDLGIDVSSATYVALGKRGAGHVIINADTGELVGYKDWGVYRVRPNDGNSYIINQHLGEFDIINGQIIPSDK